MNCPWCGENCRCPSDPLPPVLAEFGPDAAGASVAVSPPASVLVGASQGIAPHYEPEKGAQGIAMEEASAMAPCVELVPASDSPGNATPPEEAGNSAWRDEISARLNRYRARRKMRPPRYPSLRLRFEDVELRGSTNAVSATADSREFAPEFATVSNSALALDGMMQHPPTVTEEQPAPIPEAEPRPLETQPGAGVKSAKIIEFPRFAWASPAWGPPSPPPDQLAEPVSGRPRILEAPEIVPPPPALGGITIEAAERHEVEKRPGIDFPLQSASLGRRVLAIAVDGLIVAAASAMFGAIFWKVAAVRPPLVQLLGLAAGVPCLLWAVYQYLLMVYTGGTPGLRAAKLELARFDGTATNRRLRRWRALAACLSAVSLGMGYVWVFLDEDALCWHDRITHTYLAPGKPYTKPGPPRA